MTFRTRLTDASWWSSAALRALYTAIAVALPYLGAATIIEVPWLTVASTATLAALLSIATSLAGLPEVEGVNLPWWLAAVERVVKTFAQALVSGFGGAILLTDVDWAFVLQASALAALTSLLRLVLATLPTDPTITPARTINQTFVLPPETDEDVLRDLTHKSERDTR
jgi:hypothetical protein